MSAEASFRHHSLPRPGPGPGADSARPDPSYHCRICGRSYGRADHLSRHIKTHGHETSRPAAKSPSQEDSLNLSPRHPAAGHDRYASDSHNASKAATRNERRERVASACLACVTAKAKCQNQRPCARCVKRGVPCSTSSQGQDVVRLNIAQNEEVPAPTGSSTASAAIYQFNVAGGQNQRQDASFSNTEPPFLSKILNGKTANPAAADMQSETSSPDVVGLDPSITNPNQGSSTGYNQAHHDASGYNNNIPIQPNVFMGQDNLALLDPQFDQGFGFSLQQPSFGQEMDFGMWDIDLDSVELAYPNLDYQPTNRTASQLLPPSAPSSRYAAFERSAWLWRPTQQDRGLNDQQDLNLDEDSIPSVLTPESPAAAAGTIAPFIEQKQRDQMLSLLFTVRQSPNQMPHFPSLSLLNSIIQVFFAQESLKVDNFIHQGNFDVKKALLHLVIAILSAGSMYISYPSIWRMGLALQEVVRNILGNYFEQDNRHTRNLQALQGFMLVLDVGLWSGFKRKMELAESFGQPIIIMLRRADAFAAASSSSLLIPTPEDSDTVLESKWRKWAERESLKRLVLHLFIHDTQASISFQKPPLISITEFKFSLPASRSLWNAQNAQEWARIYFLNSAKSNLTLPPLDFLSVLHNPSILLQHTLIDAHLTSLTLLYGYWTQIYSLLLSRKFYSPQKSTHQLILQTTHLELLSDLSSLSLLLPPVTPSSQLAETVLISHLLQMILYVSLEDLQRFAGKFGEEEAKLANFEFIEWVKGGKAAGARSAVWHAGQVLRATRGLGLAQCRNFVAVAVYYAALAVWVFGIVSNPNTSLSSHDNHEDLSSGPLERREKEGELVILNGPETAASKIFCMTGQGIPGLSTDFPEAGLDIAETVEEKRFINLKRADLVLGVARDIYQKNFQVAGGFHGNESNDRSGNGEGTLPPLVENLGNLLRDLGSASGSRFSRAASEFPAS